MSCDSLVRRRDVPLRVLACRPASAHSERVDQSKFGREPKPNAESGCCQSCNPTNPADRPLNPSVRIRPLNSLMMTLKNQKNWKKERMPLPLVGAGKGFGGSAILKSIVCFKVRRPWRKVNCSVTVSGGWQVHVYLHTHFVATRNSVINIILVVTFGSAALVKVNVFVKALTASTSNVPTSWNTLHCALILYF